MNGIEATKAIRLMDPSNVRMIPIIDEDKANADRAGMNRHIAKPFDLNTLVKCFIVDFP